MSSAGAQYVPNGRDNRQSGRMRAAIPQPVPAKLVRGVDFAGSELTSSNAVAAMDRNKAVYPRQNPSPAKSPATAYRGLADYGEADQKPPAEELAGLSPAVTGGLTFDEDRKARVALRQTAAELQNQMYSPEERQRAAFFDRVNAQHIAARREALHRAATAPNNTAVEYLTSGLRESAETPAGGLMNKYGAAQGAAMKLGGWMLGGVGTSLNKLNNGEPLQGPQTDNPLSYVFNDFTNPAWDIAGGYLARVPTRVSLKKVHPQFRGLHSFIDGQGMHALRNVYGQAAVEYSQDAAQ